MQKAGDTIRQLDKTVRKAMLIGMQGASDDVQSTGRDAVRQWRNKVDFKEEMTADLNRTELLIKPEGDKRRIKIFGYVDLGTRPHIITAKNPSGMLRFRTGYSAKTMPVGKYNVGSGQSFGSWVQKQSVNHPGNAPRLFLKTFMEKMIPALEVRVQMTITKAVA